MLRNTRIRTRLALMAAGPAAAALILTAITFALVPRVSIGGSTYQKLMWSKQFQVASVAPSLYIIEIHAKVQQLVMPGTTSQQIAILQGDITKLQDEYENDYNSWVGRLMDAETHARLTASHEAAARYFNLYRQRLLPEVEGHRNAEAVRVLTSQMAQALADHREATQAAADLVQDRVDDQEKAVTAQSKRQAFGMIAVALLIAAASTALGLTVLRSITERVRRLNEVATIELPQLLDEVKRAALAGEEIPVPTSPEGEGNDELTSATVAFNAVVATAITMAADQSRLRRATSQMFINLGRRNHKLLSRTLTYITQLESDERDPNTLQNLFRLDHLTTRMRRHAESLLVLAGSPPLRTWSRPVPIADVLRAALSEIETYDRVDIKELEPVEVRGASVSDLAHLLAELLENATAFSPPQTRVRVLGRVDTDGYTVVVVDEGIGMSPTELESANLLIVTPDESGLLGDSRMLGLGVVGRLAARHGFKVNLTASPVGGVVAWVTLPMTSLAPRRSGAEPEASTGGLTAAGLLGTRSAITPLAPATPPRLDVDSGDPDSSDQPTGAAPATARGQTGTSAGTTLPRPATPTDDATVEDGDETAAGSRAADDEAEDDGATATTPAGGEQAAALGDDAGSAAEPAFPAEEKGTTAVVRTGTVPGTPVPGVSTGSGPDVPTAALDTRAPAVPTPAGATGSFVLPPRAPEIAPAATGAVIIPPAPEVAPTSGPIAFRKPPAGPGEPGALTRRIRGAQLPDTGETPSTAPTSAARPERSAQSVHGALERFNAGRRTAAEIALSRARPVTEQFPTSGPALTTTPADQPATPTLTTTATAGPSPQNVASAEPLLRPGGRSLPRRVRGAQMPETDLPASAPPSERTAADVRAALSNFVAGRRAAEHED